MEISMATLGKTLLLIGLGAGLFAAYQKGVFTNMAETLKRAEMFKKADVVASTGIPLATNYGSISKVQTNTAISSGMALGQTVNYSASNLPDSSSWAADARTVHAVGQNYGAALGQSVL
jgi:hypothetical protein|tara:strand:+ start:774 stop:1130 length:357 start_codon:yes stop_codon:yes gene_type:complete